ncbi:MAG: sugar phosphate isomerase/epimerase [Ruminococcaceae bacterium]|nr:sugar phosphate isomerase/epimerase [Oscillospiraceae bacterium]
MNKIGVLICLRPETDVAAEFKKAKELGCECCQVTVWDMSLYTEEKAAELLAASKAYDIEISTLWAGWSGPKEWNFTGGPSTLGIVPAAYRMQRTEEILQGVDFAVRLGVSRVATHAGFLPENMNDPQYRDVLAALRYIAKTCQKKGVNFLFETGQETPVTLLRYIEAIGYDNVGINMDTANLILYGKANSADAITVFGKYVMDTHIKDGLYPTDGCALGKEVKVGEGMANIPEVAKRLQAVGYTGNYIIEREISGEQQTKDIIETLDYLKKILR